MSTDALSSRRIGIDTNILVRLFAADDERQREAAVLLVDGSQDVAVNVVVLVELFWTLKRAYGFDRHELARDARLLTERPKIRLTDKGVLREAAHRSREEGGDLPDHLIAVLNSQSGCSTTYTFDNAAARFTGFTLLPA